MNFCYEGRKYILVTQSNPEVCLIAKALRQIFQGIFDGTYILSSLQDSVKTTLTTTTSSVLFKIQTLKMLQLKCNDLIVSYLTC